MLLTLKQAAWALAVSLRTVRRLAAAGALRTVRIAPRIVRVQRGEIDRFVNSRSTRPHQSL
jgi:excisionase family DNA binding protein